MPEITPIMPEGTITVHANTQMPSAKMREAEPEPEVQPEKVGEKKAEVKEPQDQRMLRARLLQEKMKQQMRAERKKLDDERKQLEIERASSRKWQEAAELASQGRYIEAAQRTGISYEGMTQQILNGGQIPPAQIAEQTASELVKKELEAYKKQLADEAKAAQTQQLTEARKLMLADVKYRVDKDDKYPLVKNAESYQDVVEFIESEYHRTGRIIPVEEALDRWEAEALEGLEALLKQDKIRANVLKEPSKPVSEKAVPQTLSQRTMAPIPSPKNTLTDAERRKRAELAFYNKLP